MRPGEEEARTVCHRQASARRSCLSARPLAGVFPVDSSLARLDLFPFGRDYSAQHSDLHDQTLTYHIVVVFCFPPSCSYCQIAPRFSTPSRLTVHTLASPHDACPAHLFLAPAASPWVLALALSSILLCSALLYLFSGGVYNTPPGKRITALYRTI